MTPTDVLSGEPKAPLYIGFPAEVWVLVQHDADADEVTSFGLYVDEESARHALGHWVRDVVAQNEVLDVGDLASAADEAMREWVPGVGTTWKYEREMARGVRIQAHREPVWAANATGMKTISLSRRDALGALGR